MDRSGLLIRMHAKSGKHENVEALLDSLVPLVQDESQMSAWFAMRFGRNEFGIFSVFADDAARDAHLRGMAVHTLMRRADELFTMPPRMQRLEVLGEKLPMVSTEPDTKGLLLMFRAKPNREQEVMDFLGYAQEMVNHERTTNALFAIRTEDGEYGIFDVFHTSEERLIHLLGHVPRELARQAFTLLAAIPDVAMVNVQAEKIGADSYEGAPH